MTTTSLDDFLADVGRSQYGWPDSLRFTYDKTRELLEQGVEGDLVECGVAAGCHPAVMARACIDAGAERTIHLFDSFQGVPNGGEHDREWNGHHGDGSGRLAPTGVAASSVMDVAHNMNLWFDTGLCLTTEPTHRSGDVSHRIPPYFRLHEGWFQRTVPRVAAEIDAIAFLRLDGDLYESTKVCLQHLYPLVAAGGILVVDDWNLDGCRLAVSDHFGSSWADHPYARPTPITESGDVWWTKP